ncbi:MAG: histidine phosphatase family protein [Mycobacterium sp.]|nr:histidine phosphatase family protein [Mycobacterium sp.]
MLRRINTAAGTVIAALAMLLATALPAWAAQAITLTWVRHAQSTANAAGIIDTTVPGPGLTALGDTQAQAIAQTLEANGYDGIFVSDMVRTQLTAAPLAADLGITPVVIPGLQEINAGIFEGGSGLIAGIGYALPPVAWVLGARFVPVIGGENGNQFEARVNDAVAQIYDTGDTNPVAFSHGATIMAWTLMNVDNPDLLLAITHPLGNTAVVVVSGNPQDGWTLQSWDGIAVSPDPGLLTRLFVAVREIVVAPQTALYDFCQGLRSGVAPPSAPAGPTATAAEPSAAAVTPRADVPRRSSVQGAAAKAAEMTTSSRRALREVARPAAAVPTDAQPAGDDGPSAAGSRKAARSHSAVRVAA